MILSAQHIAAIPGLVEPFHQRTTAHGMTFGLGPAGYDVRIAEDISLERGDFVLASTIERFRIPNDVMAMVQDKSTWARRGLSAFNSSAEPGWRGHLTIEIVYFGTSPLVIRAGTPIVHMVFHKLLEPTEQPYPDDAKYQDQDAGPQPARYAGG